MDVLPVTGDLRRVLLRTFICLMRQFFAVKSHGRSGLKTLRADRQFGEPYCSAMGFSTMFTEDHRALALLYVASMPGAVLVYGRGYYRGHDGHELQY